MDILLPAALAASGAGSSRSYPRTSHHLLVVLWFRRDLESYESRPSAAREAAQVSPENLTLIDAGGLL